MTLEKNNEKCLVILTNEAFLAPESSSSQQQNRPQSPQSSQPKGQQQHAHENEAFLSVNKQPKQAHELSESHRSYKFTGVDLVEVGHLWSCLAKRLNIEMDFASPKGGPTPVDPSSLEMIEEHDSKMAKGLREDKEFYNLLGHTYPMRWVDPSQYKLVIITGSHGAMIDLPSNDRVTEVIEEIYENGGTLAAIGHGTAALLNLKYSPSRRKREEASQPPQPSQPSSSSPGEKNKNYIINNKRVCCFSEQEEKHAQCADLLPYSLEQKLREHGAQVENSEKPFESKVVEDGRIITGQNARSTKEFITSIAKAMGKSESDINKLRQ
jgi:putative intracellular protease/amidase